MVWTGSTTVLWSRLATMRMTGSSPQPGRRKAPCTRSANRQFGFERDGNGYVTYYTRGVDRITSFYYRAVSLGGWLLKQFTGVGAGDGSIFGGGGAVWENMQQNLQEELGSSAQVVAEEPIREDYDKLRAVFKGDADVSTLKCDQ